MKTTRSLSVIVCAVTASLASAYAPKQFGRRPSLTVRKSVSVPVSELEKDLTPAERSITSVVRKCGPAVAFVTSVMPAGPGRKSRRSGRARDRPAKNGNNSLPEGMGLGSGSGFVVAPGYLCTNFHVIERAYTLQDNSKQVKSLIDELAGNATGLFPEALVDASKDRLLEKLSPMLNDLPEVYVRINSETKYQKCRIVNVEPDLDLAVLKIDEDGDMEAGADVDVEETVAFGSSSELIVGQTVVAIGNPFGLDKTVTTGVVSAVNREFRAGTARTPAYRPIRNCIQTDAAINPGNSGGPLLNLKGEVIGINTAIITTSGSNAGIGFAVPADQLTLVVDRIIREDQILGGKRPDKGWLGITVVSQKGSNSTLFEKNWVTRVEKGSPAEEAGVRPIRIVDKASLEWGDAVVNVGGNEVTTYEELQAQIIDRVKGEQVALTLENAAGEKRVVYITLRERPSPS
jgi:S1-C subfamily serine protease